MLWRRRRHQMKQPQVVLQPCWHSHQTRDFPARQRVAALVVSWVDWRLLQSRDHQDLQTLSFPRKHSPCHCPSLLQSYQKGLRLRLLMLRVSVVRRSRRWNGPQTLDLQTYRPAQTIEALLAAQRRRR
jgi:hypothetical protein